MFRSAFSRQPARIVLVDMSNSFDENTCSMICESLRQLFALVCNLTGPCRMPFFGLYAVGAYPESLFPLKHVKGNLQLLKTALQELADCQRDYEGSAKLDSSISCLLQGAQEAVTMFKRQAQSLLQTSGLCLYLEIIIVTCHSASVITKAMEGFCQKNDVEGLKKVQVVSLNRLGVTDMLEEVELSSQDTDRSGGSETPGLVDAITLDSDSVSLQHYFRSWLHDNSTDQEHLHLLLNGQSDDDSDVLVIKCDLQERMLNAQQLPHSNQFCLMPEGVQKPPPSGQTKSGQLTPIHRLRVLQQMPCDSVCESVLFGMPQILRATSCWKIEWDELDTNLQLFHALCANMQEKKFCLLAKAEPTAALPQSRRGPKGGADVQKPQGHYVLFPSDSGTLLIKPVSTSDILLPCDFPAAAQPSEDAAVIIDKALDKIVAVPSYNPLNHDSGLLNCLLGIGEKTNGGLNQVNKRKTVAVRGQVQSGKTKAGHTTNVVSSSNKKQKVFPDPDFYSGQAGPFPTEL